MGARLGRWDIPGDPPMGSPTNACVGLFMLWWGWLAFNAGSTFGEFLNDKTSELPNKVFLFVIDLWIFTQGSELTKIQNLDFMKKTLECRISKNQKHQQKITVSIHWLSLKIKSTMRRVVLYLACRHQRPPVDPCRQVFLQHPRLFLRRGNHGDLPQPPGNRSIPTCFMEKSSISKSFSPGPRRQSGRPYGHQRDTRRTSE